MEGISDTFVARARQQLNVLGFWYPPENYLLHIFYRIITITSFFLIYSMALGHIVYIIDVWGDIDAVSEAIFMLFTLARRIRCICVFFFMLVCSTCSLWAIRPFLDGSEPYTLPFNVWMPIQTTKSPNFEVACVYQNTAVFISGLLFNGIDNVPLSMIMFACGQLQIIKHKIIQINEIKQINIESRNERDDVYDHLSDCIQHHQALVKFIKRVEEVYHSNIFFHVCGSVGIVCIIGLRIYIVEPLSVQFFSMISFLMAMLMQLFNYCWCGHELTATGEDLRDALYLCPWYTQKKSFNRSLWIIMERMKKPIVFRTGGHIVLSFATFVAILRSSYSYFALLKQVREK